MSITSLMARKISNYDDKTSVSSKLRMKRIQPFLLIIEEAYGEHGHVNIIDTGGTEKYWNIVSQNFLHENNVTITIVNLPGTKMPKDYDSFKFIESNGCDLSDFADNSFHFAHSNSVVEHVGDWNQMVLFAKEINRIAKAYYVQTPNYWFPIEPHCMTLFFHWFPKPIRIWLIFNFTLGHWRKAETVDEAVRKIESARLLNKKMFLELFEGADVTTEKFFFLPKSFVAIKANI